MLEMRPIDVLNNLKNHTLWPQSYRLTESEAKTCIKALEEAVNKPKTGHWIEPQQDDGMSDPIYYQVRCSECGFDLDPQTWHMELHQYGADKFCPSCGAKMVESQERSGEE